MRGDAAHPLVALNDQTEQQKQRVKELRKVIDVTVFKQQSVSENKMFYCSNWTLNAERFLRHWKCDMSIRSAVGNRLLWNSHLCDVTKGTDTFPQVAGNPACQVFILPSGSASQLHCYFPHLSMRKAHHCISFGNIAIFVESCKQKEKYLDFWRAIKS